MRGNRRAGSKGQSLVELAVSIPVLLLLFLGAFDLYVLIADLISANTAVREAGRLSAVLGGQACSLTPLNQSAVDQAIVKDVLAVSRDMNFYRVTDVYIFAPTAANGVFNPATDKYSHYDGAGTVQGTTNPFPLSARSQTVPNETSIGVELRWSYTPPTGFGAPSLTQKNAAVFKALAVPTGC